ncbi:hypothetical protein B566_EDAN012421 [Ephemera danica]|nr:hypothetical protein B566_EDAN012421 [Ephemera danica]
MQKEKMFQKIRTAVHCDKVAVKRNVSETKTSSPPRKQLKSNESTEPKSPVLNRNSLAARKRKPFQVARESQCKLIELKSKQNGPYVPGKFWKIRNEGASLTQLKDLPENEQGQGRPEVQHISSLNAAAFKFKVDDMVHCEGAMVIPNNEGDVGVEEMESALLASPGVYPKLIPHPDWVKNHYRWIVWKLASLERRFPVTLAGHLSVEHILMQLKFRYNCEIDLTQRSPVLKITTKDASPAGRMVLCVAEIHPDHLILTDSWYPIRTKIDDEMKRLIGEGKIVEGTKLMIHGAELEGSECLPLQQSEEMCLKIITNSMRKARSLVDEVQFYSGGPMKIDLGSVLLYCGTVGAVECVVTKVHPMVFAEKTVDGRTVMRRERAKKLEARQKLLEKMVAEERARTKQEQDREAMQRRKSTCMGVCCLQEETNGEWLCMALQADPDLQISYT